MNPLTLLGEDLIGLLGSAGIFEGDFEAGAADFDLLGLPDATGDSVGLAGVNFSGAWDLLLDLPRPSTSITATGLTGGGMTFLAVVVLAEVFMGEALGAGVIFLVALTGEVDLALAGSATTVAAALDDLLGSGAAFLTDSFLTEGLADTAFLTGDAAFLAGDTER